MEQDSAAATKKQQNLLGKKQSPVSRIEIVVLFFQLTLDIVALE
jgi:hypothetical protein